MIMKNFVVITLAALFIQSYVISQPSPSEDFPHQAIVDSRSSNVWLYWRFDGEYITFEMFGRTNGWVGIGISPNGGMIGADLYVGWVKDGIATITDRHGVDRNAFPPISEKQDVTLLDGVEQDGWTRIKFRRPVASCEPDYDITITTSTLKIIWALGKTDPTGTDLSISDYHGNEFLNRGSRRLFLLEGNGGSPKQDNSSNLSYYDVFNNMTLVPPRVTYYSCTMHEIPKLSGKHHVIKVEPVIESKSDNLVHHILIYQCEQGPRNSSSIGVTHECFSENMPDNYQTCSALIHAWAIGGGIFYYPDHVGFPIGVSDGPRFIMMETHYDNPNKRSRIIDGSGLRFFYTSKLRQYDAGVLQVGRPTYPYTLLIPPNVTSFLSYGECTSDCARAGMEAIGRESINIFGALLHTHLLGRAVTVHHIEKDGSSELPYIAQDTSYDFNYQEVKVFSKEINFTRGQSIQVACNYRSTDRSEMTLGGLGTDKEMCLAMLYYYPKMPLTTCLTTEEPNDLYKFFGINSTYNPKMFDLTGNLSDVIITSPANFSSRTLASVVDKIRWSEDKAKSFSEYARHAKRFRQCFGSPSLRALNLSFGNAPNITTPYLEPPPRCSSSSSRSLSLIFLALLFTGFLKYLL